MRTIITIFAILFLIPSLLIGQKKRLKGTQYNVTSTINYNPATIDFSWSSNGTFAANSYDHTFITPSTGVFEVELDTFFIDSHTAIKIPQSKLNMGLELQIVHPNFFYQEIQFLNVKSSSASSTSVDFRMSIIDSSSLKREIQESIDATFATLNYEFGKYFGDLTEYPLMLGMGANLGMSYKYHSSKSLVIYNDNIQFSSERPRLEGRQVDFHFGISTNLWINITDRFSLEFKYAPTYNFYNAGEIRQNDPLLPPWDQIDRNPDFNYYLQLGLKFKVKDFKKRTRRNR